MPVPTSERQVALHRRALWLEYFTVGWNVIEAVVAIAAGIIAGSVALIGFGVDSAREVISAVGLLWRLRKAGPHAPVTEESEAGKRALYVVAATFFLLAAYIAYDAISAMILGGTPDLPGRHRVVRAGLSDHARPGVRQATYWPRHGQPCAGCRFQGNMGLLVPLAGAARRSGRIRPVRVVVGRPRRCAGDAPSRSVAGLGDSSRGAGASRNQLDLKPVRVRRRCQAAGLAAIPETGLMWAKVLRAFQVGKARTSHEGPSRRIRELRVATSQESWPACHFTNASASAVM